jgi:hypothetical protein
MPWPQLRRVLAVRGANRGDKGLSAMVYILALPVLHKRVNSEDLTDNELDEVLNADILYNKKSYNRPTKYSR